VTPLQNGVDAAERLIPMLGREWRSTLCARRSQSKRTCICNCCPGNGLERGRNGGSGIRAAIALPALLGKLGKGSGIVLGASNAFPKTPAKLQRPDLAPVGIRTLNINDIGRHLAEDDIDPPLRALFIYNHNRSSCTPTRTGCAAGSPVRKSLPSGSS
jgi:hypothetical protein